MRHRSPRRFGVAIVCLLFAIPANAQVPVQCTPDRMPVGGVASVPGGVWRCMNLPSPPSPPAPRPSSPALDPQEEARKIQKLLEDMQRIQQQQDAEEAARRSYRANEGARELRVPEMTVPAGSPKAPAILHAPEPRAPLATIAAVSGPAFLLRNSGRIPLRPGTQVFEGDRITAEGDGYADLEWPGGSKARLAAGVFGRVEFTLAPKRAPRFELGRGLFRWISGLGGAVDAGTKFSTQIIAVGVRGTDFTMSYEESGAEGLATITVASGRVLIFDHGGGAAEVNAGEGKTIREPLPVPLTPESPLYRSINTGERAEAGPRAFLPLSPAGVWVNPDVWHPEWGGVSVFSREFMSRDTKLSGLLTMESRSRTAEELEAAAIEAAQLAVPGAELLSRERHQWGGLTVSSFRFGFQDGDQRFVISSRWFSGAQGTVQLQVRASEEATREQAGAIAELLDGLVVLNPGVMMRSPSTPKELKTAAEAAERMGEPYRAIDLYLKTLDALRPADRLEESVRDRLSMLRVQLGLQPVDRASAADSSLGLVLGNVREVVDVAPRSIAERAGFRPGDIIESVNRQPVKDSPELLRRLNENAFGRAMVFSVRRGGVTATLTLTKP